MALYRVTTTFPYFTGVPEDVSTNTMYFLTPEGTSDAIAMLAIDARLNTFYDGFNGLWSKVIISPATWKAYNMADPQPRLPVGSGIIGLTFTPTAINLPEEVAMVLSFQAEPISGANQARRRGRIYVGPLSMNSTTQPTGGAYVQWASAVRATIASAAAALADTTVNVAAWQVYSPTDNQAHPVARGWIDVQPDTQRRRGHKTVGRTLWVAP